MEGMFTKEMMPIQADYVELGECTLTLDKWVQGLVVKLLEVTHGQWLYRPRPRRGVRGGGDGKERGDTAIH